ncbi:alkaline ceramidase [Wickerhamomyces ciferrii]|uniref:Alkaline ceramidase n=2 Tax=Wickerhamomyces ciferrii TaxID=1041607 RepID=K0KPK2_WICCF|nr:alkaline ceramidase [Wickerhamomyces ciferrii]ADW79430.1 alkaline ceramidase [Wickerhamomyces ciferrii]CCH43289.1 alkaline ceramidase [Wickerhamomyces ciferrii]
MSYHLPFAKPYPNEPYHAYWNQVTSTIDWCEENYIVTPYIAEAINTISNSIFILLAGFAMFSAFKNNLELRFILISFGFALVGVGSWLFHMTLHYEFQLLDELPMIYATCIPMWSVFSEGVSKKKSITIGISIILGANLLTAIYLYLKDPTVHQVAYALLNVFIVGKSHYLTIKNIHNQTTQKQLFITMIKGIGIFLSGYFLWNLDVHFCNSWIWLRRSIGMPYGFLLELHAWWHVLTGLGVYFYIIYLELLRINLLGKQDDYELIYKFGFLPEVKLLKKDKNE